MKTSISGSFLQAFTLRELVVSMALVGIMGFFLSATFFSPHTTSLPRAQLTQFLSNTKQLHLVAQQITLDSETANTPPDIRWTCTNGTPLKYVEWTNLIISGRYLTKEDLSKLLTKSYYNKPTDIITVFAVGDSDPPETVLLATANWQGLHATTLVDYPFSKSGFVVFRKGGSGAILQPSQLNQANIIGSGGKYNFLPLQ